MRIFPFPLVGLLWCALLSITASAQPAPRNVVDIFQANCSGCHGEKMEGGKGRSLVSGKWKHGGDRASLLRSIRGGYPQMGMPAFSATLNEAETLALIGYIFETGSHKVDPQPREEQPTPTGIRRTERHSFRLETVADGLDVPWSLTFLPDGRMLVTERVGRVRVIENGHLKPEPLRGIPPVALGDEAGLYSIVAHPDYAANGWIYLSFSDPGDNDTTMLKIVRGRLRGDEFVDQETIFSVPKKMYQRSHALFGGRLAFQGEYLYFSVGERGLEQGAVGQAQDLTVPVGKIHRVFHDGSIPSDNPFVNHAGAWPSIWAYGVRNPQGLAFDPRQSNLWESEHGPRGGDELNHILRGANYGWPVVTYGINYDGTPISDKTEAPGMEPPELYWTPSIAVSEIEFYHGDRFPKWKNNLFLGSLAQQKFIRLVVENGHVLHREQIFDHLGRVRDIKTGPDGYIYVALEFIGKLGRVVRLVPADEPEPAAKTRKK